MPEPASSISSELDARQQKAVAKIAGLTIANAMVFQEVLAASDGRVTPLRRSLGESDPVAALAQHWEFIEAEIDYVPIFEVARRILLALPADHAVEDAIRYLGERALEIVSRKAALRHDLMGRVYHRLLADAKYLGTYYTSVPAATLLTKLALQPDRWDRDWSDLNAVAALDVGDLACGTGTLLMASAEAITDNYVLAAVQADEQPDLAALHKRLMENVIYGFDVLPSALHLTASTLALRASAVSFDETQLAAVPLGGQHHRLGSIEFLDQSTITVVEDLFGGTSLLGQVTGEGDVGLVHAERPELDLCVMNPPFTRSVGGNLLFGSVPERERTEMRRKLSQLLRDRRTLASTTAGLGSVFVAVGDQALREQGRMALVLPKALLSGVAWKKTRELIRNGYVLEHVVVSHDPERWNFSDNTDLSEVLVVARKLAQGESADEERVTCVNLWRNPRTAVEALQIAQEIERGTSPDVETGQGALELRSLGGKAGEGVAVRWATIRESEWLLPCAFAQSDLVRTAFALRGGALVLPGLPTASSIPICKLEELGALGPDRRDIWDGFELSDTPTAYPALWGGAMAGGTGLSRTPNRYLSPLGAARPNRPLRPVSLLWPRAGRVVIAEGLRLNTQGVVAGLVDRAVLSNVWWPLAFHTPSDEAERALVLWLNSTLGLITLLASREETQGAWVGFKKPMLEAMPVLDVNGLSSEVREQLASDYDRLADQPLRPFPLMAEDEARADLDAAVAEALGLPAFDVLQEMLAREPVVTERPLY
jgi:hypothetical protein